MTKCCQRKIHARKAAQGRWDKHNDDVQIPCADPTMMAISNYVNGSTYTKSKRILAAQGMASSPKTTYYRYQKKVGNSIIELAKESMREEANKMTSNSSISCDGAYAHRRNSSQCHGVFVDCKTKKIVAGSVVTKARKDGDFLGASNMMETEVVKRNLEQIDRTKIKQFVHDQDNKIGNLVEKSVQGVDEKIDPNHGKKILLRFWNKLVDGAFRTIYKVNDYAVSAVRYLTAIQYKKMFHGLKKHTQDWFNCLLYDKEMNNNNKKESWQNVEMHVLNNHSRCNHLEKKSFIWKNGLKFPELQNDFHHFVLASSVAFEKIDPNLHTNINESIHSETSKIADKNTAWSKDGYESRVYYSYLKHNKPDECFMLIRNKNKVQVNDVDRQCIEETISERNYYRTKRSTKEYKKKDALRRKEYKESMKSKPGDYIGIPYSVLNDNE